jgi:hypothetical protein
VATGPVFQLSPVHNFISLIQRGAGSTVATGPVFQLSPVHNFISLIQRGAGSTVATGPVFQLSPVHNFISLIQRGGGTGPTKPRQPPGSYALAILRGRPGDGANSGL